MFEGIKKLFTIETETTNEIDGYKIMTEEEIVKDNKAFNNIGVVIRYLYTKDKERDTINEIGFVKKKS